MGRRLVLATVLAALLPFASVEAVKAEETRPAEDAFRRAPLHLEHEGRLSLPSWVTWTGLAITAGLGTTMVWSFSKLSDARALRDEAPSENHERTFDRRRRQTMGLGLGTGLAAVGTILLAVLATEWDEPELSAWASPSGGGVSWGRAF